MATLDKYTYYRITKSYKHAVWTSKGYDLTGMIVRPLDHHQLKGPWYAGFFKIIFTVPKKKQPALKVVHITGVCVKKIGTVPPHIIDDIDKRMEEQYVLGSVSH